MIDIIEWVDILGCDILAWGDAFGMAYSVGRHIKGDMEGWRDILRSNMGVGEIFGEEFG